MGDQREDEVVHEGERGEGGACLEPRGCDRSPLVEEEDVVAVARVEREHERAPFFDRF